MKNWKLMDHAITQEQRESLSDFILTADRFSQGDLVREFEKKWSEWQGCKYSVFVNSGSSANFLAVHAMSPRGKDMWVAQSCTWATTVTPIIMSGNNLQLCDVNIPNLGPNIESLEFVIDRMKPKYLFLANLLGFSAIDDDVLRLCEENNITLLEDCCESHGATFRGKKVGNFGKISTFSFYYGHHLTTIEGGMVCTDDEELYERLLLLRSHGLYRELPDHLKAKYEDQVVDPHFTFLIPGMNVRSTEINAFLGLMQLENLDKHNEIRQRNFKIFADNLDGDRFYNDFRVEGNSSFCFPVIMKKETPERMREELYRMGVETRPVIAGNLYRHPFMNQVAQFRCDQNAEIVHNNGFYVGNNQNVTEEDVKWLVDFLNEV
jgi:CDP-4-dehydro-6-deoxyglucose reductase, E1